MSLSPNAKQHFALATITGMWHELQHDQPRTPTSVSCLQVAALQCSARANAALDAAAVTIADDTPDVADVAAAAATEFVDPLHDDWPHWDPPASVNLSLSSLE